MAFRPPNEQRFIDACKTVAEFIADAIIDNTKPPKPLASPPPVDQLVYNRKQAAMALGVSASTLQRLLDAGDLKPIMLTGKSPKYDPAEIKRFLDKMRANRH